MKENEEILKELREIKELLRELTHNFIEHGTKRPNSKGAKLADESTDFM